MNIHGLSPAEARIDIERRIAATLSHDLDASALEEALKQLDDGKFDLAREILKSGPLVPQTF